MANAKTAKTSSKKINPALMKPLQPSKELAAVVGSSPLSRPDVVSKMWDYIKKNNLQNPENKREILADELLLEVDRVRAHHRALAVSGRPLERGDEIGE